MKADYQRNPSNPPTLGGQWYKVVKTNAENGVYGPYGQTAIWPTLMYQWTGDPAWATIAWNRVATEFLPLTALSTTPNLRGNFGREYAIEHVILLDWLWPALTPAQRTQYMDQIGNMLDANLTGNVWVPDGYIPSDSDQTVGVYFGVVLFYLTHPEHPRAAYWYNFAGSDETYVGTGGLTASAANRASARNAIKEYTTVLGAGGEWIESAAYNLGTVDLLLMGYEGVRTATSVEHFPEIAEWLPRLAKRQIAFWTSDLTQYYQWGDEEHPRDTAAVLYEWTNLDGMASGLLQGTTEGEQLQGQLLDLVAKYGPTGNPSMQPAITGRLFFVFNPYAQTADWRTDKAFQASGMGLSLQRSGFSPNDSLFAAHIAPRPERKAVDHFVRYFNDFELYRRGEWVLTHPRGYMGAPNTGLGTNSVLMHGFGDMYEFKEVIGAAAGDGYSYQAGTTGGAAVPTPYYDPPPVFVHEWTRSILYLPGGTDTVIVHDRAHVADVQRRDRYYPADQALFDGAPSAKQWILHMPVAPTIGLSTVTWSTPGGQNVRWSPLLPEGVIKTQYDELVLRTSVDPVWRDYIDPAELKYHVRLWPAVKQDWDTFLNVIQVGDAGGLELIRQPGEVDGVRVSRPGLSDVVALFNARPSSKLDETAYHPSHDAALRRAHVRSTGYTVTWHANTVDTLVYIADLDTKKIWSVAIDGRSGAPFTPTASNLTIVPVNSGGTHTLTLTVRGDAPIVNLAQTDGSTVH